MTTVRFLGGPALIFTGIHVVARVLDSYIDFGITEILVPFTGTYRPAAVAWGVIADGRASGDRTGAAPCH